MEDLAFDCHTYTDVPNVYLLFLPVGTVGTVSNLTVYLASSLLSLPAFKFKMSKPEFLVSPL